MNNDNGKELLVWVENMIKTKQYMLIILSVLPDIPVLINKLKEWLNLNSLDALQSLECDGVIDITQAEKGQTVVMSEKVAKKFVKNMTLMNYLPIVSDLQKTQNQRWSLVLQQSRSIEEKG